MFSLIFYVSVYIRESIKFFKCEVINFTKCAWVMAKSINVIFQRLPFGKHYSDTNLNPGRENEAPEADARQPVCGGDGTTQGVTFIMYLLSLGYSCHQPARCHFPCCGCENWISETFSDFPKVTQPIEVETGPEVLSPGSVPFPPWREASLLKVPSPLHCTFRELSLQALSCLFWAHLCPQY